MQVRLIGRGRILDTYARAASMVRGGAVKVRFVGVWNTEIANLQADKGGVGVRLMTTPNVVRVRRWYL